MNKPLKPLAVSAYTLSNALGLGRTATLSALQDARVGLRPNDYAPAPLPTWIGRVDADLDEAPVSDALRAYDCRNHRLTELALAQDGFSAAVADAARRYGAHRIGVFLGTSTSGIEATEFAYDRREPPDGPLPADYRYTTTHSVGALGEFVQGLLGLSGVTQVISTACSSSAKVFAAAHRHLSAGLCDAAVVGGVDSLCRTTLLGFNALQLVSPEPCRPWDAARSGISIGEGAGFALLENPTHDAGPLRFVGYGESSDAYHMSSPQPEGKGAALAMQHALDAAGLTAAAIDYLNLHGTATQANDAAEDCAVLSCLGDRVPCSSTKGATGHMLGAAGVSEALIACMTLAHGFAPGSVGTAQRDPVLKANLVLEPRALPVRYAMSNSLGFGGSNTSLIFTRVG